jgi:Late exocytosis, associated with Golgi transport
MPPSFNPSSSSNSTTSTAYYDDAYYYNSSALDGNVTTRQNALLASNESDILRQTFRLYGSVYLCCFVAFCFLRRPASQYAKLYNIRSWVPNLLSPLATRIDYKYYVGWMYQVFSVNDDDLLEHCGMVRELDGVKWSKGLEVECDDVVFLIPFLCFRFLLFLDRTPSATCAHCGSGATWRWCAASTRCG